MKKLVLALIAAATLGITSCTKEESPSPQLKVNVPATASKDTSQYD